MISIDVNIITSEHWSLNDVLLTERVLIVEVFAHESLAAGVEIIDKQHAVVTEWFAGEHLSQSDQVAVTHLLPLVHQPHALGVDQSVAVDPAETHVLPGLDVHRLVHGGHVAECWWFVHRRGWRRLQRTQTCKIINLAGKIRESLWISCCVTYHGPRQQLHLNITAINQLLVTSPSLWSDLTCPEQSWAPCSWPSYWQCELESRSKLTTGGAGLILHWPRLCSAGC